MLGVAAPAQAGWLEFFFPTLKQKGADPMETLQAPFALDPKAAPPKERPDPTKAELPVNQLPLDQPHRDNQEISSWLTSVTSAAMTFDGDDYQAKIKDNEKYFTLAGKEQYMVFLNGNNVIKVLDSKKFHVRSFVQDIPLLLNEGAVNGVYRWLYEVPMMVSYMERGVTDYKKLEPVNQQIVLTVQVGRVPSSGTDMAVLIERWDGRVQQVARK